ncbi:MAG: MBL fold metallo-hydrolase [Lachnospiraceae bacterium]|nr:MBL fold metallo-hydrolase [Lachnospiraceae bacterium]MBR6349263.1 MBL fold metallo-hydrolase [Lachnospiraceae bacterium]
MRIMNLASGSTGNSTYIGTDDTHILVDSGISRKRIVDGLNEADLTLEDIDAIFLTHEHIDHVSSLGVIERTCRIPVYATLGTINALLDYGTLGHFDRSVFHVIRPDTNYRIKDLIYRPLGISHDAKEPVCFRFSSGGSSAAIVTDLGDYDDYLVENLRGLDAILLEANHDVRMLEVGPYPYPLKRRILSRLGHLSNERCGQLLSEILHDNMREIMLGHLSRENNTRELAKLSVETEIQAADNKYKSGDFDIKIARHEIASKILEV